MSIKTVELLIRARDIIKAHCSSSYCQLSDRDDFNLIDEINNNKSVIHYESQLEKERLKNEREEKLKLHCPICMKLLKTEDGVKKHVEMVHNKPKNRLCGSCLYECDKEGCEERKKDDYSCYVYSE